MYEGGREIDKVFQKIFYRFQEKKKRSDIKTNVARVAQAIREKQ